MEDINNTENSVGSPIQEFYRNKSVFITGGTGFMGKVIVEKLLRTCPHINRIFILVRSKKNKDYQQRIQEYLDDEVFKRLDQKPRLKVFAIPGDISEPRLGISDENRKLLQENIDIVFHAAATVRFDEPISTAVAINVSGTKEMLELARTMKNLKAYVHVSTAFSNCLREEIGEKIYNPPIQHDKLITLTKCLENSYIDKITPIMLDDWPNTYVYTKSVAEDIVKTLSKGLPVCIYRPAIVVGSYQEPLPGWVDNLYGATGVTAGCGVGFIRTLWCDENVVANIVPVDMAVNALIAAAWRTAIRAIEDTNQNEPSEDGDDGLLVYNYVSSVEKPIRWGEFMNFATEHGNEVPLNQAIWCYSLTLNTSWIWHKILVLLLHFIPAIIVDAFASLIGKRTNMLRTYKKVNKFSDVLAYFTLRNWDFKNDNVQNLWKNLTEHDKLLFPFDISSLDWNDYFYIYVRGIRKYLLKEDPSSIPYAKVKLRRFKILHEGIKLVLGFLILRLLYSIVITLFFS
ncbi:fatty acyl-CoA reductase wat-like [Lycorma delicatula]|uniref:fatty acyl-CoA reductase wat-like n=1 Tax=Lycorma delicatula TaxID=130591 RepID=UPI003F510FAE